MIRALLLDLDGTLYDQRALHRKILVDLLRTYGKAPWRGYRTARALRAFRQAQETLRSSEACGDIAELQLQIACRQSGCSPTFVAACVRQWMEDAPLRHLRGCMIPAVPRLLEFARRAGIRLALCSDYPGLRKLEAMELERFFDEVVCAQLPEIGSLKPNPQILQVALRRLGVTAAEALYAGDRPEVDGAAAARAGIDYVNIVHRHSRGGLTIDGLLEKIKSLDASSNT
jgi:HAD superfamily hydrolase (TIGR01509 family)